MKIEAKHIELGNKFAKIAIFTGFVLWLLQGTIGGNGMGITTLILGAITIIAYALKGFLTKGEKVLNYLVIFSGLLFFFFIGLSSIIGSSYSPTISMMILAFLLIAGLIFELITKKGLEKYIVFINSFMMFIFGFIVGGGTVNNVFAILGEIFVVVGFVLLVAAFYLKGTTSSEKTE